LRKYTDTCPMSINPKKIATTSWSTLIDLAFILRRCGHASLSAKTRTEECCLASTLASFSFATRHRLCQALTQIPPPIGQKSAAPMKLELPVQRPFAVMQADACTSPPQHRARDRHRHFRDDAMRRLSKPSAT